DRCLHTWLERAEQRANLKGWEVAFGAGRQGWHRAGAELAGDAGRLDFVTASSLVVVAALVDDAERQRFRGRVHGERAARQIGRQRHWGGRHGVVGGGRVVPALSRLAPYTTLFRSDRCLHAWLERAEQRANLKGWEVAFGAGRKGGHRAGAELAGD